MDEQFKAEVVAVHDFLSGWLSGSLPKDPATYGPFAAMLADDFMIVSPTGETRQRADLVPGIEQAHGAEGDDFRIWIENCQVRWSDAEACVGTFEEWQESGGVTCARLSSVLFRRNATKRNGLEWVHLHETWLPGKAPSQ